MISFMIEPVKGMHCRMYVRRVPWTFERLITRGKTGFSSGHGFQGAVA